MSALTVNTNHMSQEEFVALTSFRWTPGAPQQRWERGCDHVQDAISFFRAGLRGTGVRRVRSAEGMAAR